MRVGMGVPAAALAVILSVGLLTGCGEKSTEGSGKATDPGGQEAGSQTSESKSIGVVKEFTIELESNPTTGYEWTIATWPDKGILGLTGDWFEPPKADMVGAPGKHYYRFKASASGHAYAAFAYSRSFEGNETPERTHTVDVTVH